MGAPFAALLVLLCVDSFGAGFFLLRRLPWSPAEKLSAAVGLSLLLVYLASFAIYLLGLPAQAHLVVSALGAVLLAVAWRDAGRLLRNRVVRRELGGFALLLAWSLALL